jgi:hypothetical protein
MSQYGAEDAQRDGSDWYQGTRDMLFIEDQRGHIEVGSA